MGNLKNKVLAAFVLAIFGLVAAGQAKGKPTFPDWSSQVQTWDAISLLSDESKTRIAELQKSMLEKHQVGLWVVLLDSQSRYNAKGMRIEQFAAELAGQKIRPLAKNEDYILLLVCKDDRKSRIELGESWDNEWNDGCDLITSEALVANFKRGDFDRGVMEAVEALNEMTNARSAPPTLIGRGMKLNHHWGSQLSPYTFVPPDWVVPMLLLGTASLVAAIAWAAGRTALFFFGVAVLMIAIFSKALVALGMILVVALSVLSGNSGGSRYRSSSSSWFSDDSSSSSWSSSDSSSSWSSSSSDSSWGSSDSGWGSGGGSTGEW